MNQKRICAAAVAAMLLASRWLCAQGPHEVLVLANRGSADSVRIAAGYCRLRGVPASNLLQVDLPEGSWASPYDMTPETFAACIWEPAVEAVARRGLEGRILAWVYSVDFPVTVTTRPPLSITGMTFVRNRPPPARDVERGLYASPLFCGPHRADGGYHLPQSLDRYAAWLGDDMPLPAMMLGFTGTRGTTAGGVEACLARGVAADGSAPTGTVWFVRQEDVRSEAREWQYTAAAEELRELGVGAVVADRFPRGAGSVLGLMTGVAEPVTEGYAFVPGAVADHLTSLAAVFHWSGQTKLTAWIGGGATAAAGTVTEPMAIWTKFPNARFFANYARGASILESYAQSIRCPLQVLPVGEPLARPWAAGARVVIEGLDAVLAPAQTRDVRMRVEGKDAARFVRFLYLLDGRRLAEDERVVLRGAAAGTGRHVLRAIAFSAGLLTQQVWAERAFEVAPPGAAGGPGGGKR